MDLDSKEASDTIKSFFLILVKESRNIWHTTMYLRLFGKKRISKCFLAGKSFRFCKKGLKIANVVQF